MSPAALFALFCTLIVLAALPTASSLLVAARASERGVRQGAWVALGVAAGDVVFVLVALLGLGWLAEVAGPWFGLARVAGAAWLLALAVALWLAAGRVRVTPVQPAGGGAAIALGLAVTLADHKAVLFYLGVLPAFFEVATLDGADRAAVVVMAGLAVFAAKLPYAIAAARLVRALGERRVRGLRRMAAVLLLFAAAVLLLGLEWPADGL